MRYWNIKVVLAVAALASMATASFGQQIASRPAAGQVQITAPDMCCKGCAQKVSGQLYTVKGVKSVSVDLAKHLVTVSLPQQDLNSLGRLWHAVQQGNGGPTKLVTTATTFELLLPETTALAEQHKRMGTRQHIVIDDLHCKDCAEKIASQLYTLKGVTKVSVDLKSKTLVLDSQPDTPVSPWQVIDAVAKAEFRAVAVAGNFGTLSIEHAKAAEPNNHQALHPHDGGIQR